MMRLIEFIEEDETAKSMDGPYKVAALRTAAAYYENLTQAQAMMAFAAKTFNEIR